MAHYLGLEGRHCSDFATGWHGSLIGFRRETWFIVMV